MTDIAALWNEFWVVGVIALGAVVVIAASTVIGRSRARAKMRGPQYRRHTYWE